MAQASPDDREGFQLEKDDDSLQDLQRNLAESLNSGEREATLEQTMARQQRRGETDGDEIVANFVKIPPATPDEDQKRFRDKSTKRNQPDPATRNLQMLGSALNQSQEDPTENVKREEEPNIGVDSNLILGSQHSSAKSLTKESQFELELLQQNYGVFDVNGKRHKFSIDSMYFMTSKSRVRQLCVKIVVNKWFDRFIIFCIIANSILLATKQYEMNYDVNYVSNWNSTIDKIDLVFSIIFIVECLLKVIAMGFIRHKNAYLRSPWNWIDFFIVIVSIIGFTPMPADSSLKAFRTARVLRPLRSMHQLESMKRLLNTFFNSLPGLFNVCIFLAFVFTIFSIIAVNFFAGKQYQFCRTTLEIIDDGVNKPYWPKNEDAAWQCNKDDMCSGYPNYLGKEVVAKCGDVYRDYGLDPVEYDDVYNIESINFDITHFNNVLASSLTIFQSITLEGWSPLMYNYQDTVSYATSTIFFVVLIILGAFTTLNLVLASIMHSYIDEQQKEHKRLEELSLKSTIIMKNSYLEPPNANNNQVAPALEPLNSKRPFIQSNLSIIEENESRHPQESIGKDMGTSAERNINASASVRSSIEAAKQIRKSQERSLHSPGSNRLPGIGGNTQTRFHGILKHNELEEKVDIGGAPLSSYSNSEQMSHRMSEYGRDEPRTTDKYNPLSGRIHNISADRYNYDQSPLNRKYNSQPMADPITRSAEQPIQIQKEKSTEIVAEQHNAIANNEAHVVEVKIKSPVSGQQVLQDEPTQEQRASSVISNQADNSLLDTTDIDQTQGDAEQRSKKNCCYQVFYEVVISVTFNFLIYCFILANTVTLAMYRYDESERQTEILYFLNLIFVWVFFAEMVAKLIGLGVKNYVRDKFNIFDAIIVVLSLVDFALSMLVQMDESSGSGIMSAFRALRLLRVVKLARHWKAFQDILRTMISSLVDIANFALLLTLMLFIFALLGMEMFAYSAYEDENGELVFGQQNIQDAFERGDPLTWPRTNFNDFFNSFLTVFIVIIAEDWNQYMYMYVRAIGYQNEVGRTLGILYFIMVFAIGNTIMLALFTALLLKGSEDDVKELERKIQEKEKKAAQKKIQEADKSGQVKDDHHPCPALRDCCSRKGCATRCENFADSFVQIFGGQSALRRRQKLRKQKDPRSNASPSSGNAVTPVQQSMDTSKHLQVFEIDKSTPRRELLSPKLSSEPKIDNSSMVQLSSRAGGDDNVQRPHALLHYDFGQEILTMTRSHITRRVPRPRGRSLFLFGPDNTFRAICNSFSRHTAFEWFIILLIVLSTISLAIEHPLDDPDSEKLRVLAICDLVFTSIFTLEAALKIIALGFMCNGKRSYLRDAWNVLDFIIVLFSLISLGVDADLSVIKVLRVARILRPLRLIQRAEGLKISTMAFFKAIPEIASLQVVILFMMFIISILMTTLLSGKLFMCDLGHTTMSYAQQETIENKWDCLNYGGRWVSAPMNFDNSLQGILTLFIFQTREGWVGLMEMSIDATKVDFLGQRGNNRIFVPLYMALVVILCLLFINMLVRIVIKTYNAQKDSIGFNRLLSEQQRSWIQVQIMTYHAKPKLLLNHDSHNCLRNTCIKIAKSSIFENFIMFCILLNTLVMALVWFDEPQWLDGVVQVLNYFFMTIFTLEAIIKLIAFKKYYFHDSWNIFDFTIVAFTLVMLFLQLVDIKVPFGNGPTILRALRIGRILRLIKRAKQLKIIFYTLFESAPSLCSLGALLLILFFMFAIIGRQLFGLVMINGPMDELNEHVNFRDFVTSFLLLLRCATGESWHLIMFDYARTYSPTYQCREDEDYWSMMANGGEPMACGNAFSAYAFFIIFNILVFQIFINLFVAVIIDAFLGQTEHFNLPLHNYAIEEYINIWAEFDPLGSGFIDIQDLERFVIRLAEHREACELIIMHEEILKDQHLRRRFLAMLNIPTYDQLKKVMFYDVLQQLADKVNFLEFNRNRFESERQRVKVFARMGIKGVKDELQLIMQAEDKNSMEFQKTVRSMGKLNPKIKLMTQLQIYFKAVHEKYAVYVDTVEMMQMNEAQRRALKLGELRSSMWVERNGSAKDLNLLTTRHYFAGLVVQKALRKALQKARNNIHTRKNSQAHLEEREQEDNVGAEATNNSSPMKLRQPLSISEGITNMSNINSHNLDADISHRMRTGDRYEATGLNRDTLEFRPSSKPASNMGQSRNSVNSFNTHQMVSDELNRLEQDRVRVNQQNTGTLDSRAPTVPFDNRNDEDQDRNEEGLE